MKKSPKSYNPEEKAKIALESLSGKHTHAQITAKYGVHSTQITKWVQRLREQAIKAFKEKLSQPDQNEAQLIEELYKQIGQLKVELDWVKKNLNYSVEQKRKLIEPNHALISISKQCELLGFKSLKLLLQAIARGRINVKFTQIH
jgi:putative transposase